MKTCIVCLSAAFILIMLTALSACSSRPAGGETGLAMVKVTATRDFGQELMFDRTLQVPPGTSAMDALNMVAEVETGYGGGFVNAINGVKSGYSGNRGSQTDWFVYINGILSNAGALEYKLGDGDIVHWDYRDWGYRQFIPAVIGDFPEPFRHGYAGKTSPSIVAYSDSFRKDAENLAHSLIQIGVASITSRSYEELSGKEKETANLILIGTGGSDFVQELNKNWKRLGFFAYFKDAGMVTVDSKGEQKATYGGGVGLIQATQNPWNPKGIGACENVVWMISGTDETGVRKAVDAIMKQASEFKFAYGVIVNGDEIIRIPGVGSR